MDTEQASTDPVSGKSKIEIPFYDDQRFMQLPNGTYVCALRKEDVEKLNEEDTIKLRNELEILLSLECGSQMELGFAEQAISQNGDYVILAYFQVTHINKMEKIQ